MSEQTNGGATPPAADGDGRQDYLLLFRGIDWHKGLSPEEIQEVTGAWMAWFERLTREGKARAGHPLKGEGKVITGQGDRMVVSDGPYAEAKEAIGGYFMLSAASLEEAVAIARECPGLPHGAILEVRPVADGCQMREEAERQLAQGARA